MSQASQFYDPWVELYDHMVDWEKRLRVEGPALVELLRSAGVRRVLDVACGTGRHLEYLASSGFEVAGADLSPGMVAAATRLLGPGVPVFEWSMADEIPPALQEIGPFDAVLCLGNSLPHLVNDVDVSTALLNFGSLCRPGGLLAVSMKALAVSRSAGQPYLPLVKRVTPGGTLLFVRFYDFAPAGQGPDAVRFHLVIVTPAGPRHSVTTLRAWQPGDVATALSAAGWADVLVRTAWAGRPWQPGDGADLFVTARLPQ